MEIYLKECLLMVLVISGIPLVASSIVGVVIAVIQAATQISEQSVSFAARFLVVSVVLALLFNWFSSQVIYFTQQTLSSMAALGRMP